MNQLDCQTDYWNRTAATKRFSHPVNLDRLREFVAQGGHILDYGCGYGRVLGLLERAGYRNLTGADPSPEMIALAQKESLRASLMPIPNPPHVACDDESVDAVLLFAVLTCVPTDSGQRAILQELHRVLKPGGLLYVSDLWLQSDSRNTQRYARSLPKYGTYGVFDLEDGATMRHHDPAWIETLTVAFESVAVEPMDVETMNGHVAKGFQWFALKPEGRQV